MSKIIIEATEVEEIVKVMQGQKAAHTWESRAGFLGAVATLADGLNKGFDSQVKIIDHRIKIRESEDKASAERSKAKGAAKVTKKAEEEAERLEEIAKNATEEQKEAAKAAATAARNKADNEAENEKIILADYEYTESKTTSQISKEKKDWMAAQEVASYALAAAKFTQDFFKALALNITPSKGELDLVGKLLTADKFDAIAGLTVTNAVPDLVAAAEKAEEEAKKAKDAAERAWQSIEVNNYGPIDADKNAAKTAKDDANKAYGEDAQNGARGANGEVKKAQTNFTTTGASDDAKKTALKAIKFHTNDAKEKAEEAKKHAKTAEDARDAGKHRKNGKELYKAVGTACDAIMVAFPNQGTDQHPYNDLAVRKKAVAQPESVKDYGNILTKDAKSYYNAALEIANATQMLMVDTLNDVEDGKKEELTKAQTALKAIIRAVKA